jgi:hypothetical protein
MLIVVERILLFQLFSKLVFDWEKDKCYVDTNWPLSFRPINMDPDDISPILTHQAERPTLALDSNFIYPDCQWQSKKNVFNNATTSFDIIRRKEAEREQVWVQIKKNRLETKSSAPLPL